MKDDKKWFVIQPHYTEHEQIYYYICQKCDKVTNDKENGSIIVNCNNSDIFDIKGHLNAYKLNSHFLEMKDKDDY